MERIKDCTAFYGAFREYLKANPAWGSLHVVLDDGNLDDRSVRFCIGFAEQDGDYVGAGLAYLLLAMTKTQRGKISREVLEG